MGRISTKENKNDNTAVVKLTSKDRFYLHKAVDVNGNVIKIDAGDVPIQPALPPMVLLGHVLRRLRSRHNPGIQRGGHLPAAYGQAGS